MEKFVILLSILAISGTAFPSVIAASFHEKQEIEDVNIHLKPKNNTDNLDRNKRSSDYDDLPNVPEIIKEMLTEYWISTNKKEGKHLNSDDFSIDMDIRIKSVHRMIENGKIEKDRIIVTSESSKVTNPKDYEQELASGEITITTTKTESFTISQTYEISGEVGIPSIPFGPKVGLKLSGTSSKTETESKEISRTIPSQTVKVGAHSTRYVISDLYAADVIHNYLLIFEMDETSTFSVKYKEFPVDANYALDVLGTIWNPISGPIVALNTKNRVEKMQVNDLNLKEALQSYVISKYNEYPKTIYEGSIPCIELRDDEIYIGYFPMEVKIVKIYLETHVE